MPSHSPGRSGLAASSRIPAPPAAAGDSARQQPAGRGAAGLEQGARASPSRIPHITTAAAPSTLQALQPTSARRRAAAAAAADDDEHQRARHRQQPLGKPSPPRLPRVAKQQQQQQQQDQHLQPWLTHRQSQPQPHQQNHQQQQQQHQPPPQQQASHSKLPAQPSRNCLATHALSGYDASKQLHEVLVTQQRRREQFWLAKYGRLLGADPKSLYRHPVPAGQLQSSGHSSSSAAEAHTKGASSRPIKLPQLPGSSPRLPAAPHTQPAAAAAAQTAAAAPAAAMPAARWRPDAATVAAAVAAAAAQYSSSWAGPAGVAGAAAALPEQQQQQERASQVAQLSAPSLAALRTSQHQLGQDSDTPPAAAAASQGKPCRDLAAELQVVRVIRAREDAIDKLAACCSKMGAAQAGGGVLLATEPLFRLFFRLVASYRSRTLEVVEAHAAWQRRLGGGTPAGQLLLHQGRPYLTHLGERLSFLDAAGWLSGRLLRCSAVQDPLLSELTPDGVPIEDVTSFDMRRGPVNFSAEALRVRMARTVLAAAGAPLPPHMAGSLAAALQQQQHLQEQQQIMDAVLQQEASLVHQQHDRQAQMAAAAAAALNILLHRPPAAAEVAEVAETAAAAIGLAERLAEQGGEHGQVAGSSEPQRDCSTAAAAGSRSSSSRSEPAVDAPAAADASDADEREAARQSQFVANGAGAELSGSGTDVDEDGDSSIIDAMLAALVASLPAAAPSPLPSQCPTGQQSRLDQPAAADICASGAAASSCGCQDAAAIDALLAELVLECDADAAAQCIDQMLEHLLDEVESD